MSFSKEQLAEVNGLQLSDMMHDMNANHYNEYTQELAAFTECFPARETELKNLLAANDYEAFSKVLLTLSKSLEKIQANGLAQNCHKLMSELGEIQHDVAVAHLTYLLAEISALSIGIQMAQHALTSPSKPNADMPVNDSFDVNKKTILAVDDVSFLLKTLKSLLINTEYNLIGVTSGEDALRYIDKHKPDLILLDIEMPIMNGYELAEKIRNSGETAPIIFLTGNAKQEYVIKAIKAGGVDFIVKPVNRAQVLEKIKKHIC